MRTPFACFPRGRGSEDPRRARDAAMADAAMADASTAAAVSSPVAGMKRSSNEAGLDESALTTPEQEHRSSELDRCQ